MEGVNSTDIILAPWALITSVIALVCCQSRRNLWIIASYSCIGAEMLLGFFDINSRIATNDIAGVMDIYPTMAVVYCILFVLVTAVNSAAIIMHSKDQN